MKSDVQILLFFTEEDIENARRARALTAGLTKEGWTCTPINRLSNKLDDLLIVAQHRVLQLPRWMVLLNTETWRDELQIPTYNTARKLLQTLEARVT